MDQRERADAAFTEAVKRNKTYLRMLYFQFAVIVLLAAITAHMGGTIRDLREQQGTVQAVDPLPTPDQVQEQINAVLEAHHEQGVVVDGNIGTGTKKAWDRALVLQGGDEIMRREMR